MAYRDKALRLEISGTLGIQVASLLMRNDKILILIHPQKRALVGVANEQALEPVLKASSDPKWFYNVFFDEPIDGWSCRGEPVERCDREDGLAIIWSDRDGEKKRVSIKSPSVEIQILVKSYQTKVQSPEQAFKISVPESYKKFKLN